MSVLRKSEKCKIIIDRKIYIHSIYLYLVKNMQDLKVVFSPDFMKIESGEVGVYKEDAKAFSTWKDHVGHEFLNWNWLCHVEQNSEILNFRGELLDFIQQKRREYSIFLDGLKQKETAQKQGSFPQTDLPKGSVLLASLLEHGHMYRAYSQWVEEKHFKSYFVTIDGSSAQYTRGDNNARKNFALFFHLLESGLLTEAGKRYSARNKDAKYGRDKIYDF